MFDNYNSKDNDDEIPIERPVDSYGCPIPLSPVSDPFRYCGLYDYEARRKEDD